MWVFIFYTIFQQLFLQILWKKSWVRTLIPLKIVTVFRFAWIRVILQIFLQNMSCFLLLEHIWALHASLPLTGQAYKMHLLCTCIPKWEKANIISPFFFFPLEKGQFPGNLQQCATVSREELLSDCDISQSLDWQHVKKCYFSLPHPNEIPVRWVPGAARMMMLGPKSEAWLFCICSHHFKRETQVSA